MFCFQTKHIETSYQYIINEIYVFNGGLFEIEKIHTNNKYNGSDMSDKDVTNRKT